MAQKIPVATVASQFAAHATLQASLAGSTLDIPDLREEN
jgi:hypothetical protein